MNDNKKKQEKERQKDFMHQLYDESNIENFFKKSIGDADKKTAAPELEIPDIGTEDVPEQNDFIDKPEGESVKKDSYNQDEVMEKMNSILEELKDTSLQAKLENLKSEIFKEVEVLVKDLQTDLNELKDRKVPKRRYFDTGGVYKEQLYLNATHVLDNTLIDLFEDVPDYHLINNHITKVYDDGTVQNAVVTIGVTVNKDGYRYDFKAEVPVLNGIMHTPTYINRGIKIIPLTEEAIAEELDSLAFRKPEVEDTTKQKNMFNNTGENILRRRDDQKFYPVQQNYVPNNGLPEGSTWNTHRTKGR